MIVGDAPAAEVAIDEHLVRSLLEEQHPDLARLPLISFANGWDNVTFRLGEDFAVRLPRRTASAQLIEHEQRWLPELATGLPLPVPAPARVGRAGCDYPWSWSICPWLPGEPASARPPDDAFVAAEQLGAFVTALAVDAPPDAPHNEYRGGPLHERDVLMRNRIAQLGQLVDGSAVLAEWEACVAVPKWSNPPRWLHGDLHPANLLVAGGRISAVIDFGDITSGDPANDLAVAWMVRTQRSAPARQVFRAATNMTDDDTWERARGWALFLAIAFIANSADDPVIARIGRDTLDAAMEDT